MTRRFDPTPIPEAVLDRVLSALAHLPSAGFAQGIDALVLTTPAARDRFWAAAADPAWRARATTASGVAGRSGGAGASGAGAGVAGILAAPVVVVPVGDPDAYVTRYAEADKAASDLAGRPPGEWPVPYWLVDGAFAVLTLLLAAEAEGLGGLFFRLHAPADEVLAALGAPGGRTCIGAVALGRRASAEAPSGSPRRRPRRGLDEVVHREGW